MKTRFSFLNLRALFLCAILTIACGYNLRATCLATAFQQIVSTLLLEDLSHKIEAKLTQIVESPRWGGGILTDSTKRAAAATEMQMALCAAQAEAKKATKDVGINSASELSAVMTSPPVLASNLTPLEEAGKGVGRMAVRPELPDDNTVQQSIKNIHEAMTTSGAADAIKVRNTGHTTADVLGDMGKVLENNPNIPAGETFTTILNTPGGNPGYVGVVAEFHVGAVKVKGNEKIIAFDADKVPNGKFKGMGVDIHTDKHIYQVGLTSDTVEGKLNQLEKNAPKIKAALDTLKAEKLAGNIDPNARYKFAYTIKETWEPNMSQDGAIAKLNQKLASLYAPATPPQIFGLEDFEALLLGPQ